MILTGAANLETSAAITLDTVFEIGSVSKQFIGAGLAVLAGRGQLRLDDPIGKWLPELPPLYRGITVAMIAHHTSGIRSWNNLAELTGRNPDSTGYDNAWVLAALARQRALNFAPGTEYLYSNSNFVLAAIIIERASGQSLNAFFRDALFARLGMDRTEWRVDFRKIVLGRAQAYSPLDAGGWQLDMPLNGVAGAGGLLSTVGDLQRWNATLADPTPADRPWVELMLRPGRLALAQQRLVETGATVTEAAMAGGFSTPQSFSRAFRRATGLSPTQFLTGGIAQPLTAKADAPLRIELRAGCTLVALRKEGGAYRELNALYWQLWNWAESAGTLDGLTGIYGLPLDDPHSVPEDALRYDAALALANPGVPPPPFRTMVLPAGEYASVRHLGSYDGLEGTNQRLIGQLLASSREPGELPLFHHFLDDPEEVAEADLRTDVLLLLADTGR